MADLNPDRIPILCFYTVLTYVNNSMATDRTKINDLKFFYNRLDSKHKCYFRKAVYQIEERVISEELILPKWLIQFEAFIENDSSGS